MIEQAGQLDRRVTIQKPVNARVYTTNATDAFGQRVGGDSGVVEGEDCVVSDINELGGIEGDPFGQLVVDYITLAQVWANVKEKVGNEGEKGDMLASTKKVEFIIRYRTDVNAEMRVLYNNEIYKIETVQNADARKAYLKLVCLWSDAQ